MDFVIKFASEHESFRLPEIEALAVLEGVNLKVKEYSSEVRKADLFSHNNNSFAHFYHHSLHFASSSSHQ